MCFTHKMMLKAQQFKNYYISCVHKEATLAIIISEMIQQAVVSGTRSDISK